MGGEPIFFKNGTSPEGADEFEEEFDEEFNDVDADTGDDTVIDAGPITDDTTTPDSSTPVVNASRI